jgi:hypothetical protein
LADLVEDLAVHQTDWDPGRFGGQWSLAGAQPKVALFRDSASGQFGIPHDSTPTTVILKPAIVRYAQHHINETADLLNRLPIEDRDVNAERFSRLWPTTSSSAERTPVRRIIRLSS